MSAPAISATLPPPPAAASPVHRTDFADWLSPILVKELRQGLKTRAFITVFILLQAVMVLLTGLQLLETASSGRAREMDSILAFMLTFALLVLMPGRGLASVSEEVRANTLDLVQLTRLTAFRIVLGKWVALIAQTALLVTAILPYALLRYFFGEVNILQDLVVIGALFLASMVLTAGAIALSSAHVVVRFIMMVVLFFGVVGQMAQISDRPGPGTMRLTPGEALFVLAWFAALHIWLLLEIAAGRIAPRSENHSGRKRCIVLIMLITCVCLLLHDPEFSWVWVILCEQAFVWVIIESLSERTILLPSVYGPFARWGLPGRLAGRLLYPGWASGFVFVLVLAVISMAAHVWIMRDFHLAGFSQFLRDAWLMYTVMAGTVLFPLVFILMFPRARSPVWIYLLVQALSGLAYVIATAVHPAPMVAETGSYRWLAFFPGSAFVVLMDRDLGSVIANFYRVTTVPFCATFMVYLGIRALMEFSTISRLERLSQNNAKSSAAPDLNLDSTNVQPS